MCFKNSGKRGLFVNIILSGSTGRMGQEIKTLVQKDSQISICAEVSRKNPFSQIKTDIVKTVDVVIDFSLPENFSSLLDFCFKHNVSLVSGTTGLTTEHFVCLDKLAQKTPVLWAPNMSLGIHFLNKIIKQLKYLDNNFQFQVEEIHHVNKKDKPGGTALFLQNTLEKSLNQSLPEIKAYRKPEVVGEHTVQAFSDLEILTLKHKALKRQVFAYGALKAAQWILRKPSGRYEMSHLFEENI